jgi:hypothetical protein
MYFRSVVNANGYLWAAPGPYLRESMLIGLARVGGGLWIPEAYEQMIKETKFTLQEGLV